VIVEFLNSDARGAEVAAGIVSFDCVVKKIRGRLAQLSQSPEYPIALAMLPAAYL
jgi:hypothetical protein